jgi:hypothetical protein
MRGLATLPHRQPRLSAASCGGLTSAERLDMRAKESARSRSRARIYPIKAEAVGARVFFARDYIRRNLVNCRFQRRRRSLQE